MKKNHQWKTHRFVIEIPVRGATASAVKALIDVMLDDGMHQLGLNYMHGKYKLSYYRHVFAAHLRSIRG